MASLDDAIGATTADPLDAAIDGVTGDKRRANIYGAVKQNPDEYAKAAQLSRATGLPAPVVARNLAQVRERADFDALDSAISQSPALRRAAEDPGFAILAKDDTATLAEIERTANRRSGGTIGGPAFVRNWDTMQASRGVDASIASAVSGIFNALPQGLESTRQGIRMQFADAIGSPEMSSDAQRRYQSAQAGVSLSTPEFDSDTARGVYSGFSSLIRQAPGVAASLLLKSPLPGLGYIGGQTESEAYGKYRVRGATAGEALIGGVGEGVTEVATEMLPMGFLVNKMGKVGAGQFLTGLLAREVPSEQIATLVQDAIDTAVANPDKTWGQYLAERPSAAYQTLIATVTQAGGMGAINEVARRVAGPAMLAEEAQGHAETVQQLSTLAVASKLRERDPQTFQEYVEAAAPGQEVYLDTRALQQAGVDMAALAQVSPTAAAQMQEAVATGGDLVIPMSEYAAHVAGTPLDPVLTPHLRSSEEALSLDEAQRYQQTMQESFQKAAAQVMEEKAADDAWQQSAKAVEAQLFEQLKSTGRFTNDVNTAYSTLMRDFYVATASRLGITPQEMFARYPLRVAAERIAGDQRMEQGAPLTENQFYRDYVQHIDIRGRDGSAAATRESVMRDGFKKGIGPNALPPHRAGKPLDIMDAKFRPQVGDVVYLAPRGAWTNTPNGAQINEGWKPAAHEVITITEANKDKSAYELYREALAQPAAPEQSLLQRAITAVTDALGITQPEQAQAQPAQPQGPALDMSQFFQSERNKGPLDEILAMFAEADTIELTDTKMSEEQIDEAERAFLSHFPETVTKYRRTSGIARRIRKASDAAANDIGEDPAEPRVVAKPLGPFSGYRAEGVVLPGDDAYNPGGVLKVKIYGKEQVEAGLLDEAALTFTVMQDGELSVNGPTPGGETFKAFEARGWAELSKAGSQTVEGWSNLIEPNGGKMPIATVIDLLADVHARTRAWKMEEYTGLHWARATGALAALGDYGSAVFFQDQNRDLIVQHNLTAENLLHAQKMGGIPVPSLAITKKDHPLTGFGEITLLGSKEMADPKGYAGTKVFGADIYSPRYPDISYKLDAKSQKKLSAVLDKYSDRTGVKYFDLDSIERTGPRGLQDDPRVMAAFLDSKGIQFETSRREVRPLPDALLPFANDTRFSHDLAADPAFIDAVYQSYVDEFVANNGEDQRQDAEARAAEMRARGEEKGIDYLVRGKARDIESYQRDLRDAGQVDTMQTKANMNTAIEQNDLGREFEKFTKDLLTSLDPKEKIFQGFTNSGNRRYIDHTLDNVVKLLKKELRGGENFNYGVGSLRAKFTPQFKSIEQIRKSKDRLMGKAEFEQVKDEIDNEFWDVARAIDKDLSSETAIAILEGSAKMGVKRAAKNYGFDISDEAATQAAEFLTRLRNLPTEYFEAKILREVDLAEFSGAVIPEGADPKVIEALQARGVKDIRTYKKGDEADRAAKVGEFENLFFQPTGQAGNRGEIAFGNDITQQPSVITLFNNADLSTFLHEMGHFQLEVLAHIASQPNAPAGVVEDMNRALEWFGIKGGETTQGGETAGGLGQAPVASDAFKAWFGDSKVVDAEGKPLVVYHGSSSDIDVITSKAAVTGDAKSNHGIYLTANPEYAGEVAKLRGETPATYPVYLAISRPFITDKWDSMFLTKDRVDALKARGFDGVINYGSWEYVAFDPTQIKSAISNNGQFNSNDPNILRQDNDAQSPSPAALPKGRTPLEVWNAMSLEETRPYHEQFARGFEAYLFEGKAPTPELNGLFARFRAWLVNVYKSIKALNVEINDEIRGVFDRLVATDGAIKAAEEARGMAPLFTSPEQVGDAETWAEYQRTAALSTTEATEQLQKRSLRDMRWLDNARGRILRELQNDARAKRKAVAAEVRAEVEAEPVWQAKAFMRENKPTTDAEYELVAQRFGFTSADHMRTTIKDAGSKADLIAGRTDQRMLERYGDITHPDTLARAVDEAIHNEARTRFVATELKALTQAQGPVRAITAAAKAFAETVIARKQVKDIKPNKHAAAETRAAKAAEKALAAGDLDTAATEKRNQLVQNTATRLSYDALTEIDKALRYFGKFDSEGTRKNLDAEYLDQIDALLERFDFRKSVSNKDAAKRASLLAWVESQQEQGFDPDIPPELLAEAQRKPYKEMTLEELRGLVDTVKQIEHFARLKHKLLTAADQRAFEAVRDDIVASIQDNAKKSLPEERASDRGFLVSMGRLFRYASAIHRKFSSLARGFDGYKDGGPAWEYLVRNMNERGNFEAVEIEKATVELTKLLGPVMDKANGKLTEKQYFPSIGKSFSREERIGMLLNMGNETNLERLLTGERLSPAQLQQVVGTLTKADTDFVNAVHAFIDSYWGQIADKERRVTGKAPEKVEAVPYTLTLADGTQVPMRGGYYPIAYDPIRSERSSADLNAEIARQVQQGFYARAQTKRGHTKARVESTGRPLRYDFGEVISAHITQVVHDLAWHEYLIDANRLLRNGAIEQAVREHYGVEVIKEMKDTLRDIAIGSLSAEKGAAFWNHLRYGTTIAGLGFNVFNTIQNLTGITQSVSRIGSKWVAKGAVHWFGDAARMESAVGKMHEKSDFMRLRAKTMQREINDIRNKVSGNDSKLTAAYFYLQTKTQLVVDTPTWWGAYEKAMAQDGMDERRAVALADQAVIDAQGSGQTKDLAGIQRGGAGMKLFTTFYSFFNTTFNLTAEAYGRTDFSKPKDVALFAADVALLYSIPALLTTLLKAMLMGDWDDEDKLAKKIIGDQISFAMGTVVGLREASAAVQAATGTGEAFGYTGPASVRFFADLYNLGKQVQQGEADEAFWKALNNTAGVLFHYPAGQINRTVSGIVALSEGRTESPGAVVMGAPHKK